MSIHKISEVETVVIFARQALLANGWADNVLLTIENGVITSVVTGAQPKAEANCVDTLLPALGNVHSHTFQRGMAGLTEMRVGGRENFWTWRDLMYRFVDQLTPDHIEVIASLAFMEMQEAGYASVGEFHYVHHQKGGVHYDNRAELSDRIFAAAHATGIGLTHLPVLYTYGGARKSALSSGQLRFGNDLDQFQTLVAHAETGMSSLPADCRMGIAPHSLRATSPEILLKLLAASKDRPVHMHIAEQTKEVEEIEAWLGARPVEWLLNNADVVSQWCLIHATHMSETETTNLARTGAVAGLCPITEANLGDGIFNGASFLNAGGAFGIGTDSNVQISLPGELRLLEYSQRLRERARNVMIVGDGSVGHALYTGAAKGGAQALGRDAGEIGIGKLADLVAINSDDPALFALSQQHLLDGFVFAAKENAVTDVWSAGRHCVVNGKHVNHDNMVSKYKSEIRSMLQSL
jgi:formimidoylglutamate deiminase